jgi:hypothetical protein
MEEALVKSTKKKPIPRARPQLRVVEPDNSLAGIAARTVDPRRRRFILALDAVLAQVKPDDMDDIEKVLERVAGRTQFEELLKNNPWKP